MQKPLVFCSVCYEAFKPKTNNDKLKILQSELICDDCKKKKELIDIKCKE